MGTNPGTRSWGWRHGLWLGAACLLVLAVAGAVVIRFSDPAPLEDTPSMAVSPPAAQPEPVSPPPRKTPPPPPAPPPPAPPMPERPVSPPAPVAEPASPEPPPQTAPSDPFEPQEGQQAPIRTLVAVGDIQLGVVQDSRIRDEAGLKKVLVRIGSDLEKRIQEQQQQGQGPAGLQQMLDNYRDELGQYMDGEVELRGPGWMIGTEVGPPRPREQWWKPRPQ